MYNSFLKQHGGGAVFGNKRKDFVLYLKEKLNHFHCAMNSSSGPLNSL